MEEDKSGGIYEPWRSFLLAQVNSEFCSLCGWNDSLCCPLPQRRAEINRNTFQILPGHPPCLPRFPSVGTIFSRQLKLFSLNMQTPLVLGLLQHSLAHRLCSCPSIHA